MIQHPGARDSITGNTKLGAEGHEELEHPGICSRAGMGWIPGVAKVTPGVAEVSQQPSSLLRAGVSTEWWNSRGFSPFPLSPGSRKVALQGCMCQ